MVADIFLVSNFKIRHPYHIVEVSPWPFLISFGCLMLTVSFVSFFQGLFLGLFSFFLSFFIVFLIFTFWCFDVLKESDNSLINYLGLVGLGLKLKEKAKSNSNYYMYFKKENNFLLKNFIFYSPKYHTGFVRFGLKFGFMLFIVSEIMFFFSFFWAYFHSSLAPVIQIGSIWPPSGLTVIDPWGVPFLNTLILVTSGATLTFAHYSLLECQSFLIILDKFIISKIFINIINVNISFFRNISLKLSLSIIFVIYFFFFTMILAFLFIFLQFQEYVNAPFSISDGIYGSIFFLATGFHGLHVIIGTFFLLYCFFQILKNEITKVESIALECAIWYWHFVDVVWLFLFITVYWWGNY